MSIVKGSVGGQISAVCIDKLYIAWCPKCHKLYGSFITGILTTVLSIPKVVVSI